MAADLRAVLPPRRFSPPDAYKTCPAPSRFRRRSRRIVSRAVLGSLRLSLPSRPAAAPGLLDWRHFHPLPVAATRPPSAARRSRAIRSDGTRCRDLFAAAARSFPPDWPSRAPDAALPRLRFAASERRYRIERAGRFLRSARFAAVVSVSEDRCRFSLLLLRRAAARWSHDHRRGARPLRGEAAWRLACRKGVGPPPACGRADLDPRRHRTKAAPVHRGSGDARGPLPGPAPAPLPSRRINGIFN